VRRARSGFLPTLGLGASEICDRTTSSRTVERGARQRREWRGHLESTASFRHHLPPVRGRKHNAEATRYDVVNQRPPAFLRCRPCLLRRSRAAARLTAAKRRLEKADATLKETRDARPRSWSHQRCERVRRSSVRRSLQIVANRPERLEQSRVTLGYALDAPIEGECMRRGLARAEATSTSRALSDRAVVQRPDVASLLAAAAGVLPSRRARVRFRADAQCASAARSPIRRWPVDRYLRYDTHAEPQLVHLGRGRARSRFRFEKSGCR